MRWFFRGSELREQPTLLCSAPGPEMVSMCRPICNSAGLWPKDCPFHFLKILRDSFKTKRVVMVVVEVRGVR